MKTYAYDRMMKTYRDYFLIPLIILAISLGGCKGMSLGSGFDGLKYKAKAGQQYEQTLVMTSDMILPIGIPNADYRKSTLRASCEVTQVNDQGEATIRVTLQSLQAEMKSLGVKANYDSEQKDIDVSALESKQKKFYESFKGIVGSSYTVKVDAKGQVLDLGDIPASLQAAVNGTVEGSLGQDQLVLLFSRDNLKDLAVCPCYSGLEKFAGKGLDPNATWTDQQRYRVPRALDMLAERTYIFQKIEKDEQRGDIAIISYEGLLTAEQAEKARQEGEKGKFGMHIVQGMSRGTIEYSLSQDAVIRHSDRAKIEIRTTQMPARKPAKGQRENKIFYDVSREIVRQ